MSRRIAKRAGGPTYTEKLCSVTKLLESHEHELLTAELDALQLQTKEMVGYCDTDQRKPALCVAFSSRMHPCPSALDAYVFRVGCNTSSSPAAGTTLASRPRQLPSLPAHTIALKYQHQQVMLSCCLPPGAG